MDIHILCFTERGEGLACELKRLLVPLYGTVSLASARKAFNGTEFMQCAVLSDWTRTHFLQGNALVFIGSCGIAVRAVAPFVKDKARDPAVLAIDEGARFVIPLLGGHIGGANALARTCAPLIGAVAVLSTATDVRQLFAVDVMAAENGLAVSDMKLAKDFSACLLACGKARLYIPPSVKEEIVLTGTLPPELAVCSALSESVSGHDGFACFSISPFSDSRESNSLLQLIPPCLVLGIGCRKGKAAEELILFIEENLARLKLSPRAVGGIVSIDAKRDEEGLVAAAQHYGVPFTTFPAEVLQAVAGTFATSPFVKQHVGVDNVCERAVMAAGAHRLLCGKTAKNGMTLAIGIRIYHIQMGKS